jgi:hypothetical protein
MVNPKIQDTRPGPRLDFVQPTKSHLSATLIFKLQQYAPPPFSRRDTSNPQPSGSDSTRGQVKLRSYQPVHLGMTLMRVI